MRMILPPFLALLTGTLLLSACAGSVPGQLPATMSVPAHGVVYDVADGSEALTVRIGNLGSAGQRIQALAADVERLWVQLRTVDGRTYSQWIDKSLIAGDQVAATFSGLRPGLVHVRVSALDGQDTLIGEVSGATSIVAGSTASLDLLLRLTASDATVASPAPLTSDLTANVTLIDGAVASDSLPRLKDPVRAFGLGGPFSRFFIDPNGDIHITSHAGPTFRRVNFPGDAWVSLVNSLEPWNPASVDAFMGDLVYVDAQGRFYTTFTNITRHASNGYPLGHTSKSTTSNHPKAIAVQATGEIWFADGQAVSRTSSDGTVVVGTFDLGSTTRSVLFNEARQEAWVSLSRASRVVRLSASGQVLSDVTVGSAGGDTIRDLALDPTGNLWVLNHESGLLTKLDPDGKVLHVANVGRRAIGVAVDDFGNAWAASWREGGDLQATISLFKVTPQGQVVGFMDFDSYIPVDGFHIEFDRHGNLFVPLNNSADDPSAFNDFAIVRTLR